ncbi:MAG: N-(5'-phosphoribosyl)anthranilate isomerase [Pseudooceanicola sp.]
MPRPVHMSPDDWIAQIFSARAVRRGGVVRRDAAWVEREVGRARFLEAVAARGFHLLEGGGQFIVICNPAPFRVLL